MTTELERQFMELAIKQAKCCPAGPDPRVGAVAVSGDQALAKAYRGETEAGRHAEYILLENRLACACLANATVYTTLEPCTRRNPPKLPCVERLVQRKLARVVVGMLDPNPIVSGLGCRTLRQANITVDLFPPDLMAQIEELNREFLQSIETNTTLQTVRDIATLATRGGTARQGEARASAVRQCQELLLRINQGSIPIPGGESAYFTTLLNRISESPQIEGVKAFIRFTSYTTDALVQNWPYKAFLAKLAALVETKKATFDYIFCLFSKVSG